MDTSSASPWSGSPNAPRISHPVYFSEKVNFAGFLLSAVFYGASAYAFAVRAHLTYSIRCSRDCYRSLPPMYEGIIKFRQSHERVHQAGARR